MVFPFYFFAFILIYTSFRPCDALQFWRVDQGFQRQPTCLELRDVREIEFSLAHA